MIPFDLSLVKACLFDVDGVLSKTTVPLGADGMPCRTANIKDGYAIQLAMKTGLRIAIVTGALLPSIRERYITLGVEDIYLGAAAKCEALDDFCKRHLLTPAEVLFMGDDIPDYEVMRRCGLPCCPSDAASEIKAISTYVSPFKGGEGCVRDVLEQILRVKGIWMNGPDALAW